jgi:phosphoglycerate dehydrogenase-like enzyme
MERLRETYGSVTVHDGPDRPTKADLEKVARDYDVAVCGMAEEFDEDVAVAADRLKAIGTLSIGLDHLDLEALRSAGVTVVNVEEANVISVAEHTWMFILSLHKRLIESHRSVVEGSGRDGLDERPADVNGRTLGVVGAGSIGYEVAKQAEAFGTETLVWTFNPDHHEEFDALAATFVQDLPDLIDRSDVVTIHLSLSEKTEGLIDGDLLTDVNKDRLRVLVNTSRSEIVAREVYDRLGDGTFDAAGLDVFPNDLPDETSDRVYFTPHTAGITQEASDRMREEVLRKLEGIL